MANNPVARLGDLVTQSHRVVIMQANNPDGDSLASALALAEILSDLECQVELYCYSPIPHYLRFIPGWDRVYSQWSNKTDLVIMVDNSNQDLLSLDDDQTAGLINRRLPLVIIDHHASPAKINQPAVVINHPEAIATGQVIYRITQELGWSINNQAANYLATSILADSLGFTSQAMTNNSEPLSVMANLVGLGADLAQLNQQRLAKFQLNSQLINYKGQLLQRIEWLADDQIAVLVVEHDEIKKYSLDYNPTIILDEMRFVKTARIGLGFKKYLRDGCLSRITVRIRCYGQTAPIAQQLAEHFGGGGHSYAAGIKWQTPPLDFDQIKDDVCRQARQLLKANDETKGH